VEAEVMAHWHTVRQGECLASLAAQYGLPDWRAIYNHPENASFQQKRPNPNVIAPGDRVYIPDKDALFKNGTTDSKNPFVLARDKTSLLIVAADQDGNPYQQYDYKLTVGENVYEGKTDSEGMLRHVIDARAAEGELTVWWPGTPPRHCTWQLKLGHLDPVNQISGIQARLNNLGYNAGPVDGILGPLTKAAVTRFQQKYQLTADGDPGPITQSKLEEIYGC
jgi:hypothetical protein